MYFKSSRVPAFRSLSHLGRWRFESPKPKLLNTFELALRCFSGSESLTLSFRFAMLGRKDAGVAKMPRAVSALAQASKESQHISILPSEVWLDQTGCRVGSSGGLQEQLEDRQFFSRFGHQLGRGVSEVGGVGCGFEVAVQGLVFRKHAVPVRDKVCLLLISKNTHNLSSDMQNTTPHMDLQASTTIIISAIASHNHCDRFITRF